MILITIYQGKSTKGLTIPMWVKTSQSMFVSKVSVICADPDTLLNKGTELQCRTKYFEQKGKIW